MLQQLIHGFKLLGRIIFKSTLTTCLFNRKNISHLAAGVADKKGALMVCYATGLLFFFWIFIILTFFWSFLMVHTAFLLISQSVPGSCFRNTNQPNAEPQDWRCTRSLEHWRPPLSAGWTTFLLRTFFLRMHGLHDPQLLNLQFTGIERGENMVMIRNFTQSSPDCWHNQCHIINSYDQLSKMWKTEVHLIKRLWKYEPITLQVEGTLPGQSLCSTRAKHWRPPLRAGWTIDLRRTFCPRVHALHDPQLLNTQLTGMQKVEPWKDGNNL